MELGKTEKVWCGILQMNILQAFFQLLIFPGGLFLFFISTIYEWVDRKLVARYQNRVGPRWIQPVADMIKLLAKEEIIPTGVHPLLFRSLPVVALAAILTSALYTPMAGLEPVFSFRGDLIVVVYLLSMMTLCLGLAGANTPNRFSLIGATRTLTQLFSYEAPFLLALLGPAIIAGTWQVNEINQYASSHLWFIISQPIGFLVALIGLMGKLELPPFDAPEAETEIVSGALTEYSGRGFALFRLGKDIELVIGLTLVSAFYLGGLMNPIGFLIKTLGLLVVIAGLQSLFARLRIDQTVGLWWRIGALLALLQLLVAIVMRLLL
jgi:NADH-quinone oxidoreductase subunit H